MKKSISVIIPLYNEETGLKATLNSVNSIVKKLFDDYELLMFDDGSTDRTGEILDRLAKNNSNIRVFHNKKNMNLGYNYKTGIKHATKNYVMLLPAPDNASIDSIENFMTHVGDKPVVSAYIANQELRPKIRRIFSRTFTNTLNLLFGLHLKHYLTFQAYETSIVKKIKMTTNSFALPAEILIRLIKKGYPHKDVPMYNKKLDEDKTTIFRLKNIIGIIIVVLKLFLEINLGRKEKLVTVKVQR